MSGAGMAQWALRSARSMARSAFRSSKPAVRAHGVSSARARLAGRAAVGVVMVLVFGRLAGPGQGRTPADSSFPHERHAGLFPGGCVLCHGGDDAGPLPGAYPEPARCRACHDGARLPAVGWAGRSAEASILVFDHEDHAGALAGLGQRAECQRCHGLPSGSDAMGVGPAVPQHCLSCHAPGGREHLDLAGTTCTRCHPSLAENPALPQHRIDGLPRPASHGAKAWVGSHGWAADASCAVCHARESCERCHLNGEALPAVRALERDGRVARLVAEMTPVYPRPADHVTAAWGWTHGPAASADAGACANCHARENCASCHPDGRTAAVVALSSGGPGARSGAGPVAARQAVHRAGFAGAHGAEAAAGGARCASCHGPETCTGCHAGASTPSFHDDNFAARHGSQAFAADSRCTSCHNTELFCRACHATAGAQQAGGAAVFHDREPFWLIGHGQAARQGLETCVSCHTQASCSACHSSAGGWGVSPHGSAFDARRAEAANPLLCRRCHLGAS